MTRLNRTSAHAAAPAPVRAVHLGLGGFHRAHQAVYTAADPEWGIAAYTFRSTQLPRALDEQEGLYSLQVRSEQDPTIRIVDSISRAHSGTDSDQWLADTASPEVALITLTITEAAYRMADSTQETALGRIVAGLWQRYRNNAAPIALVPCDNLPANGTVLRRALQDSAASHPDEFHSWLDQHVSCVNTVVDRITPATTQHDLDTAARLTGLLDCAPVTTEPFSEWLLAGEFPLGRPCWEEAGARFVDNVDDYQQRKLWFLNGAHSLLAYAGLAIGCATIDEAVRQPWLARLMRAWWDTAARHATLGGDKIDEYRALLQQRFEFRGIQHNLSQIAADGSQKLPARILPVLQAERHLGNLPEPAIVALAGWIVHLRTQNGHDSRAAELTALACSTDVTRRVLANLHAPYGDDTELINAVDTYVQRLGTSRT